ncbi:bile acid:sodium symporter family protein [Rubrobacter aplysinae]|uniref:bile acid:sodium symporter family protein n=1 Tax=Rubrobacter aplysinae TaxID=909625 RepID=UPI00064BE8AD|nr:bile acid:sodium symporter family protein [Rubrobacter aplysinae]
MAVVERVGDIAGKYFALWVVLGAAVGFFVSPLAALTGYIAPLLGLVMFGMGLTLTTSDFARVFRRPAGVAIGVAGQFTIMPIVAFLLALALRLPPELAAGVILLGCCPGGTASNVITYLARGDVSLSVSMTAVSTVLAPLLTPLLMLLLTGTWLPVDAAGLFWSIVQIVLLPVAAGVAVNTLFGGVVRRVRPVLPLVSVVAIVVIVAAVVAASSGSLLTVGPLVLLVVVLHNLSGYALGYGVASALKITPSQRRAMVVEVGMQNSGLAAALATTYFGPVAALPGAVFSVWHNVSGPALATFWSRRPVGDAEPGGERKPRVV